MLLWYIAMKYSCTFLDMGGRTATALLWAEDKPICLCRSKMRGPDLLSCVYPPAHTCAHTSIPPADCQANQNNIKPAESQTSCDEACHAYTIIVVVPICKISLCWWLCLQLPLLQPVCIFCISELSHIGYLCAPTLVSPAALPQDPQLWQWRVPTLPPATTVCSLSCKWIQEPPWEQKGFSADQMAEKESITICCCVSSLWLHGPLC